MCPSGTPHGPPSRPQPPAQPSAAITCAPLATNHSGGGDFTGQVPSFPEFEWAFPAGLAGAPYSFDNVIPVAATTSTRTLAGFSNYGANGGCRVPAHGWMCRACAFTRGTDAQRREAELLGVRRGAPLRCSCHGRQPPLLLPLQSSKLQLLAPTYYPPTPTAHTASWSEARRAALQLPDIPADAEASLQGLPCSFSLHPVLHC